MALFNAVREHVLESIKSMRTWHCPMLLAKI